MFVETTGATILVVDDDEDSRVLCERELRRGGYGTHSASSGAEALRFIKENRKVDLIVLDVRMPTMSGIEVLKRLRERNVKIPIILYSDYSAYRNNFLSWLADAYLIKSSDLRELKRKIRELLGLSEST